MNDTTFNAAANATIRFAGYDDDNFAIARTKTKGGINARLDPWNFDIIEHYRALLRDEFGILALESRLEGLNVQEDDNVHMQIYADKLLEVVGEAIEQELELVGGLCVIADDGRTIIAYHEPDADKLAQLDDKKDYILARADYLGVLDLVQIWTSKKKAA